MTDLSKTIVPKSDQMNADDLITGAVTIRVTKVSLLAGEQPIAINYDGDNGKPYKPCKSMRRVLVQVWGSDGSKYAGRSLRLYCDPEVTFGKDKVGGIRISHMSHIDKPITLALTAAKARRKPFTVHPLTSKDIAPEIAPEVREAGEAAAGQGVAEYTAWLASLPPAVKATVRPMHKEWSDKAQKADLASMSVEPEEITISTEESEA